jgi:hypothetical protein
MHKKGDLAVTLLVFMIIVLIAVTLFSFVKSSGKEGALFGDVRVAEAVLGQEEAARFDLMNAGKRIAAESYDEVAAAGISSATKAESEFMEKIRKKAGDSPALRGYNNLIIGGNNNSINFALNSQVYRLQTKPVDEDGDALSVGINYQTDVRVDIDLRNEGLHSFGDIASAGESCLKDNIENLQIAGCLNTKLFNFDASVEDKDGKKSFIFKTKREYLINHASKKIEFSYAGA